MAVMADSHNKPNGNFRSRTMHHKTITSPILAIHTSSADTQSKMVEHLSLANFWQAIDLKNDWQLHNFLWQLHNFLLFWTTKTKVAYYCVLYIRYFILLRDS